jgi:hypothetical protein
VLHARQVGQTARDGFLGALVAAVQRQRARLLRAGAVLVRRVIPRPALDRRQRAVLGGQACERARAPRRELRLAPVRRERGRRERRRRARRASPGERAGHERAAQIARRRRIGAASQRAALGVLERQRVRARLRTGPGSLAARAGGSAAADDARGALSASGTWRRCAALGLRIRR